MAGLNLVPDLSMKSQPSAHPSPPVSGFLLMESGDFLLLEDGSKFLLE